MDAMADSVGPLLQKVNNTMDSLAVTVSGINALLSDKNRTHISNTLAHLERTMASVQSVSRTIEGRSDELAAFVENLSILSSKLNSIAEKADTTIAGVNDVVTTISESDLQGVISSMKILLDNMNDPDGTIGKLFVDNSVYDSVDTLLNDIDTLIRKIQENPKKYLRISVF
jgi:phospholipid/cholesterol/gamma-HCH transport system substrate-binding protein